MEYQWHQPDHMQIICTSLQTDNHVSTSSLNFFKGRLLFLMPNPKHQRTITTNQSTEGTHIHIRLLLNHPSFLDSLCSVWLGPQNRVFVDNGSSSTDCWPSKRVKVLKKTDITVPQPGKTPIKAYSVLIHLCNASALKYILHQRVLHNSNSTKSSAAKFIKAKMLIDWVKVLRPTQYKKGHFGDVLPSQTLGTVLKKLNLTQQGNTHNTRQNGKTNKQKQT